MTQGKVKAPKSLPQHAADAESLHGGSRGRSDEFVKREKKRKSTRAVKTPALGKHPSCKQEHTQRLLGTHPHRFTPFSITPCHEANRTGSGSSWQGTTRPSPPCVTGQPPPHPAAASPSPPALPGLPAAAARLSRSTWVWDLFIFLLPFPSSRPLQLPLVSAQPAQHRPPSIGRRPPAGGRRGAAASSEPCAAPGAARGARRPR